MINLHITETAKASPTAFLIIVRTDLTRSTQLARRYLLAEDGICIGNTAEADILIATESSEQHQLQVVFQNNNWFFKDVKDFTGAYLNGVIAQRGKISDGDILQIGRWVFEFCFSQGLKSEFYEEIYKSMQMDLLTQAYNRTYLENILKWEIDKHVKSSESRRVKDDQSTPPMCLLMLDIDHFGSFNKKHGHLVGNDILQELVERMKSRLRSTDVVVRWGGEEFVIYLPNISLQKAQELAEQIRQRVQEPRFNVRYQNELEITVSIGVAAFQLGMTADDFFHSANLNMLKAKENGRNQVFG